MTERYVTLGKPREEDDFSPRGGGGYTPRAGQDASRTIYVGQLRYDTDERVIRKWFEAYGPVAAVKLIYDKETGRSKGFGFVTFDDDRDARDALNDAGGRDLDGAAIKVNIAHGPAFFQPFSAGGRGRGRGFFPGGRGSGPPTHPRVDPRARGFDRRDERYSPGRYSPRSRSRSPGGRKHEREPYPDDAPADKRRRNNSLSRSRSSGRSASPSVSPSRSRSGTPPGRRVAAIAHGANGVADAPSAAAEAGAGPPAALPPIPAGMPPPAAEHTPPGLGVGAVANRASKPPPSAEAVKKELLRLRKQEQELGGRVRSLEDRVAKREGQLAQRDQALHSVKQELAAVRPQLQQYKQWVTALLEGTSKLISGRKAVAAAEAEAQRRQEQLAALQQDIEADAPRFGLDFANGGEHVDAGHAHDHDDDAAWEQLAADIQESERVAAAGAGSKVAATAEQAPPPAPGSVPPVQPSAAAPGSDMALQAVMQEAAMEEDEPNGWMAGKHDATGGGGRFEGMTFAVPPSV
ncbi:hypothetical protein D9Q98_006366 [Chlorella vulgaris]|uniref:RRM domain-containing protein n=1 Tax=Chlorella vulgaris TaxID=3077 RepID=A0A9D4YUY1_CHLVU|nr:hypothetical protein D9Q98_006366 [Chlorella vulgaris]